MGPLPALYKVLIVSLVLVLSVGFGVWLATSRELPMGGFGVGIGAGSLLAYLAVHDFRRARPPV